MVLYYFDAQIIGRGSGRSALGAAAYRMGGVLRSAAYRAGEELRDETGEIVHDYTRKGGVVYSEIILPDNAPPEFADRQMLWNAVDAREKRKDSQLAREIVVALQREFDAQENMEVLREYIRENFVDKGMCADFSVHNKGDDNPHAHIMLTMRHVSPDGFGLKNTDWNDRKLFVEWRKGWADVNNRMFEQKGLEERISHLSLAAQGIDREPTIHLGAHAAALEKKGIRTKRGDINREIERRNAERAAQKAAEKAENTKNETTATNEKPANDEHTIEKTAGQVGTELNIPSRTPDATPTAGELRLAEHLNKLKEYYTKLEKDLVALIPERNKIREELPRLNYRAESMDEHAQNIEVLQSKVAKLQENRQNMRFLQWKKKQEADTAIKHAEHELKRAEIFFKNRFYIDPPEVPEEIKRIQKTVREKEADLMTKNAAILEIMDTQDKVLLGYHTQKLLAEADHDKNQLSQLLEKLNKAPENIRDRQLQERIDRRLNIIPDESFRKVLEKLPPEHAQTLIEHRKRTQEIKQEQEKARERNRSIERSR